MQWNWSRLSSIGITVVVLGLVAWQAGPFCLSTVGVDVEKTGCGGKDEAAPDYEAAKRRVCTGLLRCYRNNAAFGRIALQIQAELDAEGHVNNADILEGAPAPAVRACLLDTIRKRHVKEYTGGAATVTCSYTGTLEQDDQRLRIEFAIRPRAGTQIDGGGA